MHSWRKPRLSVFFWIAAAAWCGMLFFFSGQNADASSSLSLRLTRFVMRVLPTLTCGEAELNEILRTMAHFGIFMLEGFLLGAAMMTSLPNCFVGGLLSVVICAVVAVLNEYHQSFVDGRACEVSDMLVDTGGALTGTLFAALVLWLAFRLMRRRV